MHILLAGAFRYFWYEDACAKALESLGHRVSCFPWDSYLNWPGGKVEERLVVPGPSTLTMNAALTARSRRVKPNLVLVWRGTHVLASTVRAIRRLTGAAVVHYNNDDPFGPSAGWRLWRIFRRALPAYDRHLVYRPVNVDEYLAAGARRADVLMPYAIPEKHHPVELTPQEQSRYGCDVVFVGHYEDDGRAEAILSLMRAGLTVRVWGPHWPSGVLAEFSDAHGPIRPAVGAEYVRALCGARLCLSFLSRLNRDTYTRRSFEIPACGRLMLSERTADLENLFVPDQEAVFFSSTTELLDQARSLLADPGRMERIARAGRERCARDGHDVTGRMRQLLNMIES